jgi:hypothetical protein
MLENDNVKLQIKFSKNALMHILNVSITTTKLKEYQSRSMIGVDYTK